MLKKNILQLCIFMLRSRATILRQQAGAQAAQFKAELRWPPLAAELEAIAEQLAQSGTGLLQATPVSTPVSQARTIAANLTYGLASCYESLGQNRDVSATGGPDDQIGGNGLLVHGGFLRQQLALLDVSLALNPDNDYGRYQKCLTLEALAEYQAAAQLYQSIRGHYADVSQKAALRCQEKLAGRYDAKKSMTQAFDNVGAKLGFFRRLFLRFITKRAQLALAEQLHDVASSPVPDKAIAPEREAKLLRALAFANKFAEALVFGDFQVAQSMLAKQRTGDAESFDLAAQIQSLLNDSQEDEDDEDTEDANNDKSTVFDPASIEIHPLTIDDNVRDAPNDITVYLVVNSEQRNEAINVTICQEHGAPRIREIEWGRP